MSAPARASRRTAPAKSGRGAGWSATRLVAAHAPARSGARRAPFLLLVACLLVGGLCALLALNTAAAAEELRRHAIAQSNAGLADDVQQLRAELDARQAPAALASAAARLGMVPAGDAAFLSLQPDGRAKVLGSPQPAAAPPAPPPPTPKPSTTARPSKPKASSASHPGQGGQRTRTGATAGRR